MVDISNEIEMDDKSEKKDLVPKGDDIESDTDDNVAELKIKPPQEEVFDWANLKKNKDIYSDEEREKFSLLLEEGFIDTYRYLNPNKEGMYSWWSYRFNARANNAGWRIDYFCISRKIEQKLVSADIHTDILGSDHCPVEIILKD